LPSKEDISKFWRMVLPPYCFGDNQYFQCSARYSTDFCSVSWECTAECRRKDHGAAGCTS